jgi:glycosyltransferase involved in cell wall biosynthesis
MLSAIRRFFNPGSDPVTICIPAYNASAFIGETVQSVLDQTHLNIQVLISVDAGNDDTETVIRRNFSDSRIRLYVQSQRLGWVANTNFLLAAVQSPYFCILPHDDIIAPGFVSRLLTKVQKSPQAVAAYCDIRCFGASKQKIVQPSVAGRRIKRITNYLCNHYDAVLMRSLVNREALGKMIFLRENPRLNFAADTLWGLELALYGELIRLPRALYRKRYHERMYHRQWQLWDDDQMLNAWVDHCLDCLYLLKENDLCRENREAIMGSIMRRFGQENRDLWQAARLRSSLSQVRLKEDFRTRLKEACDF